MHYYTHVIDKSYINKEKEFEIDKNTSPTLFHKVCNTILHFENLNEEFNTYIMNHNLNIPQNILLTNKKNQTKDNILTVKDINKESKLLIQKRFYFDFILFNYTI
jgi:hypothetical protein